MAARFMSPSDRCSHAREKIKRQFPPPPLHASFGPFDNSGTCARERKPLSVSVCSSANVLKPVILPFCVCGSVMDLSCEQAIFEVKYIQPQKQRNGILNQKFTWSGEGMLVVESLLRFSSLSRLPRT